MFLSINVLAKYGVAVANSKICDVIWIKDLSEQFVMQ
jgi:hypothetical protein